MMGFRSDQTRLMHYLYMWEAGALEAKEHRYLKHRHQIELDRNAEEKRLKDIALDKKKECVVAALECMGCRNDHTRQQHHFLLWATAYLQAKEARYVSRKHEHTLDKAIYCMGSSNRITILQVFMHEWHMLIPEKVINALKRDT